MPDFLLELRSEEIPARMQAGARAELEKLFRRELIARAFRIPSGGITVWSTPRRLTMIARGLPDRTDSATVEIKGPKADAPDRAIDGFLGKHGASRSDLIERSGVLFYEKVEPGLDMKEVLAEAIPAIIRDFSWPKSMRWGAASLRSESLRWVRPLSGIVALLGDDIVECEVHGVTSGAVTLGHRFHHSGDITIGGADDYAEKLRACHVIVDHEERAALIRTGAQQIAAEAGLELVADEGLVVENAGLTEWPVPLLGRFDASFLDVPPEVIQLTARVNQKYFVCTSSPASAGEGDHPQDGGGVHSPSAEADPSTTSWSPSPSGLGEENKLANAFICTANIASSDGGAAIVDGNRKVLAARLSDARFFWEQDRKTPLAEQATKLERITFHEKLGSVADKVERVAKLARWLVEEDIVKSFPSQDGEGDHPQDGGGVTSPSTKADPSTTSWSPSPSGLGEDRAALADLAEQAARLAKADLVTEMVGEFPELQGLMGGYYARAEGLPDEVADAIRDHYKPVGQGDEIPTAPVTVAVSLADKLDTLFSFFSIGELPTGSKDPFALRRAAIAVIRLIEANGVRVLVSELARYWNDDETVGPGLQVEAFLHDRLGVMMRVDGVRYDVVQASTDLENRLDGDVWRVRRRASALQTFLGTDDGANLLAAYKRASNILKKEDWHGIEGEIAETGEEDPLALVDDPDMKAVIDAKMTERHAKSLSYTPEPAEDALIQALASAEPAAATAVAAEDFAAAMAALASLRAPIDRFFEEVTVNDDSKPKRAARLDLLARFRAAVHTVANFARIEG